MNHATAQQTSLSAADGRVLTPERLAAALSRWAETKGGDSAWFWIDGGSFGEPSKSYVGLATQTVRADFGQEAAFIAEIQGSLGGTSTRASQSSEHAAHGQSERDLNSPFFSGGWIVALSYEFCVARLGAPAHAHTGSHALALRADAVVEFDWASETATLRVQEREDLIQWRSFYLDLIDEFTAEPLKSTQPDRETLLAPSVQWEHSDEQYATLIGEAQQLISEGEAYVLCLTNQAQIALTEESVHSRALRIFKRLRETGKAPRAGLIVAGDEALVSASPERFLSLRGRSVSTAPIKGTRPRGATPEEDVRLATELQTSPKERAENTMIVDLLRNDLTRVCKPESVAVESLCRVESYEQVHQLVSVVSGRLRDDIGLQELLDSTLPGGSMTGAPKERAVQHLARLEGVARGLYSGVFGLIDWSGDLELAMTIRSVELRQSTALVGAGGGITSDSVVADEVEELHLKARAVLGALDDAGSSE